MAKAWKDVISSPQYQSLAPEQKAQAQEQYFNEVVAPKVGDRAGQAKQEFYSAYPTGIIEKGNIDIHNRPVVKNDDGSISTVRSMSTNIDGREVLIPTVSDDGRVMSDDEAVDTYFRTGKHLGMFDTPEAATAYAESLHDQQADEYLPKNTPPRQQPGSLAQGMMQTSQALSDGQRKTVDGALSFREKLIDSVTGESKMTPEMESMKNVATSPELNSLSMDAIKAGWSQLFGSDSSQQKILESMGGKARQDEKGNVIISLPSGEYALNKPGLSPQDVTSFIANALAFTPAARAGSVVGATLKSGATDLALQGVTKAVGGEGIDPLQTAVSAGIGGIGKGIENTVSAATRSTAGSMSPEAQQAVRFADQNNLPLMTSDVVNPGTFTGKSARALGEKIPITGTGGVRRNQQEARSELVQQYSRQFGAPSPQDIIQSLQRQSSKVKQAAGQRMSQVESSMQSAGSIVPSQAISTIDTEIARLSRLGAAADTQTIGKLKTYRDELSKGADFGLLKDLRTQFRQDVKGDRVVWPNQSQAAVNRVYSSMTGDVNKSISDNLGPQMAFRYKQANAAYAHEAQQVNSTRLKSVLQKGELTPEVVNNLLFSNKPSEVRMLYGSLDSKGRSAARASVIGKAYEKSGGSPDKFLNEVNRLSTQTGILFKGADRQYLHGVTKYLDSTRHASRAGAVTPTGQELFQVAVPAGVASDVLGTGGVGTAAFLSYGALARAYESKPVRNAMLRLANTPKGSTAYDRNISSVIQALTVSSQASQVE